MEDTLPSEVLIGAHLRGEEHGWELSSFLPALGKAEKLGYACLGGQFQFRLEDSICEMYWLYANSKDRLSGEGWDEYCKRSCTEVREDFERLLIETDFRKQAGGWPHLPGWPRGPSTHMERLVFVAYFVNEVEWLGLQRHILGDKLS